MIWLSYATNSERFIVNEAEIGDVQPIHTAFGPRTLVTMRYGARFEVVESIDMVERMISDASSPQ